MRPAKRRSYFGRGNIEAGKNRTDLQNLSLSPSLALSLSLSLFLEGTDAELQPQGVQCEPEACNERRIMVSLRRRRETSSSRPRWQDSWMFNREFIVGFGTSLFRLMKLSLTEFHRKCFLIPMFKKIVIKSRESFLTSFFRGGKNLKPINSLTNN